jgi:hypothetical protein
VTDFPRFIGMVHLAPLPGSPRSRLTVAECEAAAVRDAETLEEGGADALIVENFGDAPFRAGSVEPHTLATMTRIVGTVRRAVSIPIGVNVLRNDAASALAIALACDAAFIRVNIHTGVMVTDQGLITGRADDTMRLRRHLGADHIHVFADVLVKHAVSLGNLTMADAVDDAVKRGLADAIVVSGSATGKQTNLGDLTEAVQAAGSVPVYIGSGATVETIRTLIPPAFGAIIGTGLKERGDVHAPVDVMRVRALAAAITRGERDESGSVPPA